MKFLHCKYRKIQRVILRLIDSCELKSNLWLGIHLALSKWVFFPRVCNIILLFFNQRNGTVGNFGRWSRSWQLCLLRTLFPFLWIKLLPCLYIITRHLEKGWSIFYYSLSSPFYPLSTLNYFSFCIK